MDHVNGGLVELRLRPVRVNVNFTQDHALRLLDGRIHVNTASDIWPSCESTKRYGRYEVFFTWEFMIV